MHARMMAVDLEKDALDALSGAIASQLLVTPPNAARHAAISTRLLLRARQSALAHRDFVTLRREGRVYAPVSDGVRSYTLRNGKGVRIDLLQLDPHASLNWPTGVVAQEVLVISGTLNEGQGNAMALHSLCIRRDAAQPLISGSEGARLYVRQLMEPEDVPEIERAWWFSDAATSTSHWEALSEGVELQHLRLVGNVTSSLSRITPGSHVGDHGHNLDEDCMMLQGDLFLGDILLRPDDYQVAPAGHNHVNSMSDTGALFYFHGHLPTAI